ncbi:diguanylate cyclase [bacterium]|nr:MAG: diguanylate cyclase [bacterium]
MSEKEKLSENSAEPTTGEGALLKPRVLLVEDNPAVRNMILDFLGKRDYEIFEASNGLEGLQIATTEKPDVILADIIMPEMDGFELISRVREQPGTMLIPIIVMTAVNNLETKINVFKAGGDGLLIKPFDLQELQVRIERAIQVSRNFMKLTYVDSLTGVYNRRFFDDRLPTEVNRTRRYQQPLALVMFDIDHFKKFNDTYGHRAGDFVLSSLAQHVKKSLRTQDIVCRYGGEEFTVIMPMTRGEDAAMVMSRIRADLNERFFYSPYDKQDFNIRISVGISRHPEDGMEADAIMRTADEALYEAKETGRNKVVLYNPASNIFKDRISKLKF